MTETILVGVRVPKGLLETIVMDIELNKEHSNRSDWVMTAIHHYMEHRREWGIIPIDLRGGGGIETLIDDPLGLM